MARTLKTSLLAQIAFLLLVVVAAERDLKAYVDPGTGSMIWQLVVAGAIGVLYYIRKFTAIFRKKDRKD